MEEGPALSLVGGDEVRLLGLQRVDEDGDSHGVADAGQGASRLDGELVLALARDELAEGGHGLAGLALAERVDGSLDDPTIGVTDGLDEAAGHRVTGDAPHPIEGDTADSRVVVAGEPEEPFSGRGAFELRERADKLLAVAEGALRLEGCGDERRGLAVGLQALHVAEGPFGGGEVLRGREERAGILGSAQQREHVVRSVSDLAAVVAGGPEQLGDGGGAEAEERSLGALPVLVAGAVKELDGLLDGLGLAGRRRDVLGHRRLYWCRAGLREFPLLAQPLLTSLV